MYAARGEGGFEGEYELPIWGEGGFVNEYAHKLLLALPVRPLEPEPYHRFFKKLRLFMV